MRELADRDQRRAGVRGKYDRSPEAQSRSRSSAYATARWIVQHGDIQGLDGTRLVVARDSVGGNMATALAILAKRRGDVTFLHQSLDYPVTDAAQDTGSYREFANGPYLTAKPWRGSGTPTCPTRQSGRKSPRPPAGSLDKLAGPRNRVPLRAASTSSPAQEAATEQKAEAVMASRIATALPGGPAQRSSRSRRSAAAVHPGQGALS